VKVLHVISGLTTGGAERMLEKLVPELARLGIESEVVCLGPSGSVAARLQHSGTRVHFLGLRKDPFFLRRLAALIALVNRIRPDAIQGWMHPGNLAAALARLCARRQVRRKALLFWSVHQSLYSLAYEKTFNALVIRVNARLSRMAAAIVYVSRQAGAHHAAFGFDPRRAVVIPIGFDLGVFGPFDPEKKREARLRLGLEAGAFWTGLVARDDPKKDAVNFVQAAARVARAFPNARFLLLGAGMENAGIPARRAVRELGLEAFFLFHGETDRPQEWIAALDVLVSASYTEAFPNVLGEAMACGVPCVATDVGDSAYLIGEAGVVVPPRDARSLGRAVQGLIEAGPEERGRRGALGRARVRENFSLEAVARRYAALYRRGR
jgi:glycosyltransferase involved in cell wall biosynthesis